jgi:hypothetical protein
MFFVDEYQDLHDKIVAGDCAGALMLLDEMNEMSREDKVRRIKSFMRVLLVHLIKQTVEGRTTRSWDVTIRNAVREITDINKRRKAGGWYLTDEELVEALEEVWASALDFASLEVHDGRYPVEELDTMVPRENVLAEAFARLKPPGAARRDDGSPKGR